ncbi:MAG TPA: hypothetical protein VEC37_17405 [Bacillota bacterium]|nr:hypothetical protein [Bacillota bacterium]
MNRKFDYSETIFSTVEQKRVFRLADECLLEIRLVESRKEGAVWRHEYEVKGEFGRIQKLLGRIKHIEVGE